MSISHETSAFTPLNFTYEKQSVAETRKLSIMRHPPVQALHGRLAQKKTMCSQIIYTPEWERVIYCQ